MKELFGYLFFILMFIISGIVKVKSFGHSEAQRFSNVTGLNFDMAAKIVLLAGIFEIVSSLLVGYGVYNNERSIKNIGLILLGIFVTLATLIFYANPLKYKPFLSNLSILGAIIMILSCT